jgi:LacI family transcriptional regulator
VQSFLDRQDGFAEAAAERGLEAWSVPPASRPVFEEGRRLMELALAGGRQATGVFAHNDPMAVGAVRALREAGLGCPGDVSVVGYNDVPMADCFDPPLTTIRLHGDEIGRRAGKAILAAIRGLEVPTGTPPIPAELVVRSSTAPCGQR